MSPLPLWNKSFFVHHIFGRRSIYSGGSYWIDIYLMRTFVIDIEVPHDNATYN